MDDEAVQRAVEDVAAAVAHQEAEPAVQHFMSHDLGHRESVFVYTICICIYLKLILSLSRASLYAENSLIHRRMRIRRAAMSISLYHLPASL